MDRKKVNNRLFFWYLLLWLFLFISLFVAYCFYFAKTATTLPKWVGLCAGAMALLLAASKNLEILFHDGNNSFLKKIITYFYNGAMIFFKKTNIVIAILALIISIPLYNFLGKEFVCAFIFGILASVGAVFVSNFISTRVNARISHSPLESMNSVLKLAFNSGVVVAMSTIAFSLIGLVILFHIFKDIQVLCAYAFGATLVALFNCVATVVAKRACQNAKHIVLGFFEEMQENDRRNPLLLLHGVSKSCFSLSVLTADMFESFLLAIVAAMTLGDLYYALMGMFLPIVIVSNGVFASIIIILLTRINKTTNPVKTMFASSFWAIVLFCTASYFTIKKWLPEDAIGLIGSIIVGTACGYIICFVNASNIFTKYKPAKNVANSAIAGTYPAIIQALKEGFSKTFAPYFVIAFLLVASFVVPGGIDAPTVGLFGTSLAILAILSTMGVMISINTFALVSNNVNVVSGSFESEYEVLPDDKMSLLGQIGHNTIALGKNFINLCSILSAITIMIACTFVSGVDQLDILNPYDMSSLLLGCATPFLYCGMIMGGIPKIASRLVFQVKKQFRNFPQILRQEMRPDYEKCVDIAAFNSCVQVVVYTLIVLAIFALITIYFKVEAMNAFIIGVIVSSCGLIFTSSNSYLIARSAKKYFENEFINAQYSEEYGAITAVDAVYSMAKDLITPCLNVLVKFVSIIALILAIYMSNLQG